jgi:capsular exopolysaccharide synthesis family protein
MVESPAEPRSDDVREYGRILWRRRSQIALVTAGVVVAVALFTYVMPRTYSSSVSVLVKPLPDLGTSAGVQTPNMETEQALVLMSREIADRVRTSSGVPLTAEELMAHIDARVVPNTEILVITFEDPSAERAATLAQAYAEAYVAFRVDQATSAVSAAEAPLENQISDLRGRVDQLNLAIADASSSEARGRFGTELDVLLGQLGTLQERLLGLRSSFDVAGDSANIVSSAQAPTQASGPGTLTILLIGLLLGLVIAVGVALLRDRLDDRVESAEELERAMGAPVLGSIPRVAGWRNSGEARLELCAQPDSEVSESYRVLAANFLAFASRERVTTLVVTSAVDGEGKTTTASNLAVSLAELGKDVVVVSADLRHPRLHEFFGIENDVGFADLQWDSLPVKRVERDTDIPNLKVIGSGRTDHQARGQFESGRLSRVLSSIQEGDGRFVVLDTPAVLEAAESSLLARVVDGVLLVADGHSTSPTLTRAVSRLHQADVRIIGAVYNNAPSSSRG